MKCFVDSSAWIALADRTDQYHLQASAFLRQLSASDLLHTSNYVLAETITRLRRTAGHHVAVRWAEDCRKSHLLHIHYGDQEVDDAALQIFKKYADQELSFVDCASMALMERLNIERIFAFDEDFRKSGFVLVP